MLPHIQLGKLGSKPSAPSSSLANLDYDYNIHGWLLAINKAYVSSGSVWLRYPLLQSVSFEFRSVYIQSRLVMDFGINYAYYNN